MDRRQRRAPRLLGSFYGPIHRVRWCKLINCTDPLWLHPSGLAEVFVVFMKSFSDFLSWSPHWVPRWSFFFSFFPIHCRNKFNYLCLLLKGNLIVTYVFFSIVPLLLAMLFLQFRYQLILPPTTCDKGVQQEKKKASCFSFILTSKLWNKVVWATSD